MSLEITKPYVGQTVRIRGQRKLARIAEFYTDIPGGVRLDRPIADFVSWNVKDLRRTRRKLKAVTA